MLNRSNYNEEDLLRELSGLTDEDQFSRIAIALVEQNTDALPDDDIAVLSRIIANLTAALPEEEPVIAIPTVRNSRQDVVEHVAISEFVSDTQNTHEKEVERSLENSADKLRKRYHVTNPQATVREIKRFIRENDFPHKIKYDAYACLRMIRKYQRRGSWKWGLSIMQILNIAWQACVDSNAAPLGHAAPVDAATIDARKRAFIETLHKAMHANYRGKLPSCPSGTCNKLLEALYPLHPDVVMITGRKLAEPAAQDLAPVLAVAEFKKLSLEKQRAIYLDWENDVNDPNTLVGNFFAEMKIAVYKQLVEEFKDLLEPDRIEVIISGLEYAVNRPNIYKPLDDLIDAINQLPESEPLGLIRLLKEKANNAYITLDKELPETFALLNSCYQLYQALTSKTDFSLENFVEARKKLVGYVSETEMNEIILPCLERLVMNKFSNHFTELKNYGTEIESKGKQLGKQAKDIASELQSILNGIARHTTYSFEEKYQNLKTEINNVLNREENKSLVKYRPAIATIFANIGIALSVVGLFFIAGKLIHSKATTGRAMFFYQKPQTHREELVNNIKRELIYAT